MGSSQRVIPQAELDQGFGLLKDIITIVKDPKGFEDAQQRARDAVALTEEEISKAATGRKIIADSDEIVKKMEARNHEIDGYHQDHIRDVLKHKGHVESEESRLKNWENDIKNSNAALLTGLLQLEDDQRELATKKGELLAEHNRKMNELSEKITEVENLKKTMQEEARATAVVKERLDNKESEMLKLVTGKA